MVVVVMVVKLEIAVKLVVQIVVALTQTTAAKIKDNQSEIHLG